MKRVKKDHYEKNVYKKSLEKENITQKETQMTHLLQFNHSDPTFALVCSSTNHTSKDQISNSINHKSS